MVIISIIANMNLKKAVRNKSLFSLKVKIFEFSINFLSFNKFV